jgi:hypothetical protein
MQTLRNWSFARVLLLSVAWIVACVLTTAAWLVFRLWSVVDLSSWRSAGIGAVSIGIDVLLLAIPIAPPVILIFAWVIARLF